MATGIRNKVVILGMGCSKFGERWDMSAEDLMIESFQECIKDAGIEKNEILSYYHSNYSHRCLIFPYY